MFFLNIFITVHTKKSDVTTPSLLLLFYLLKHGLSLHQVVASPITESPIAQSAQRFKELCDRVTSPNDIRGGGHNSAEPTDGFVEDRPLAQHSRLCSTAQDAVESQNAGGRDALEVSDANAQQQQPGFSRKCPRSDNGRRVAGHEVVRRATGARKSLVSKKRQGGQRGRGSVSGHARAKVQRGQACGGAGAEKSPLALGVRVQSGKEHGGDGGFDFDDETWSTSRSNTASARPTDETEISCFDPVNADDTERTGGVPGIVTNICIRRRAFAIFVSP